MKNLVERFVCKSLFDFKTADGRLKGVAYAPAATQPASRPIESSIRCLLVQPRPTSSTMPKRFSPNQSAGFWDAILLALDTQELSASFLEIQWRDPP